MDEPCSIIKLAAPIKPGLLTNILTAAFVGSAISAVGFAGWYLISVHQLQTVHGYLMRANYNNAVVRGLVAESLEYRKRNPAIDLVLQSVNLLGPALTNNVTTKP